MIETVYNTSEKCQLGGAIWDIIEKDKEKINYIIQYQFIQKSNNNYVIKLAVKESFKMKNTYTRNSKSYWAKTREMNLIMWIQ